MIPEGVWIAFIATLPATIAAIAAAIVTISTRKTIVSTTASAVSAATDAASAVVEASRAASSVDKKLDHITVLTNSTLTAANIRIAELEKLVEDLTSNVNGSSNR